MKTPNQTKVTRPSALEDLIAYAGIRDDSLTTSVRVRDAARAEHVALKAVAEAAELLESQVLSVIMYDERGAQGSTTDRNEPNRRLLRQSLAALAAIRGGKGAA